MIYLKTDRLVLRDYQKEDFEAYYKLKKDPKTMYYLQDIQLFDVKSAQDDFRKILEDMLSPNREFYFMHIELKDSREQVGSIGYTVNQKTPVGKLVHAGYFIYPKFWGKGYTTEAFRRVIEFAFDEDDVYRISTGCLAENTGSEKVMQKCGLIKEAEHVDYEWHDGKIKTRLEYRLLKSEFRQS